MPLTHLPSLQHQHLAVLPPLRASHPLGHSNQLNQLNQHFPLQQQTQQYSPQHLHTVQQAQQTAVQLPPAQVPVATTVDLTLTGPLRRGKWTRAEEDYAAATISYFCDGLLAIQYGTTLRGYLAQQLHCDPMRISKKLLPGSVFAGIKINPKIGRRAYYPCAQDSPAAAHSKENAARHLTSLRQAFIQSIEEEEQALEAASNGAVKDSTKTSSPKPTASIGRKRSYDDINSVVRAQQQQQTVQPSVELTEPQIFYHFQNQAQPALFNSRYSAAASAAAASTTATTPVMCKLPKLTVTDDVSRRASYSTQQRSVSPVTVATSTAVLPPLRVSLVRASMC
ncbi:hypothetical protein F441_09008 [Phytophthora nicotianae CJ01A1]|uniref:Uncharacterized protein n=4 Tax=Phytophthora nicotianae TaxID=4792 RepID=W2Q6B9_PHYN3|nr:hypothetical protein PPTG_11579 [Phytophthora nicotianae INRA-310]ETK86507.1 hypothetical protein L915_08865 [Phytophthora nicotianae]ETP16365.1 hypothetical protein F441_09008 [Phytophthora nicotianae CJ01A1]ETP44413.1 hypothetical protein F442_08980 [Phytophthora nicotianae P10297]ETL39922.1 hypothetical protein L916_08787 [Phytophthora nicotianae]ETL93042.1 hypothetical protein L917_08710 [Phytophthora nicotianae]